VTGKGAQKKNSTGKTPQKVRAQENAAQTGKTANLWLSRGEQTFQKNTLLLLERPLLSISFLFRLSQILQQVLRTLRGQLHRHKSYGYVKLGLGIKKRGGKKKPYRPKGGDFLGVVNSPLRLRSTLGKRFRAGIKSRDRHHEERQTKRKEVNRGGPTRPRRGNARKNTEKKDNGRKKRSGRRSKNSDRARGEKEETPTLADAGRVVLPPNPGCPKDGTGRSSWCVWGEMVSVFTKNFRTLPRVLSAGAPQVREFS